MIVRRLAPGDDVAPAVSLLQRFFREEGFDVAESLIGERTRVMLGLETCMLLVAEVGIEAAAVATLSLEYGIEFGWWAEMGDLYVLPGWRGQGVARRMIAEAEALLRARGVAGYQVTVTPFAETHHGLARFYAGLGFSHDGRKLLTKRL